MIYLNNSKADRKDFTLIELLLVIAVIVLLAGLLLPALRTAKLAALQIKCKNNLKNTLNTVNCYINDYNGYTPAHYKYVPGVYEYSWIQILQAAGYINGNTYDAYACPAYKRRAESGWKAAWSLLGMDNTLGETKIHGRNEPSKIIFFADSRASSDWQNFYFIKSYHATTKAYIHTRHNNFANCGFADGHVDAFKWNNLSYYGITCIWSQNGTEIY